MAGEQKPVSYAICLIDKVLSADTLIEPEPVDSLPAIEGNALEVKYSKDDAAHPFVWIPSLKAILAVAASQRAVTFGWQTLRATRASSVGSR